MSLHYLNPEDEPRDCPDCGGSGLGQSFSIAYPSPDHREPCFPCNGTGRLGNPDGPKVQVERLPDGQWGFSFPLDEGEYGEMPFPTREVALEAARKAWDKTPSKAPR